MISNMKVIIYQTELLMLVILKLGLNMEKGYLLGFKEINVRSGNRLGKGIYNYEWSLPELLYFGGWKFGYKYGISLTMHSDLSCSVSQYDATLYGPSLMFYRHKSMVTISEKFKRIKMGRIFVIQNIADV